MNLLTAQQAKKIVESTYTDELVDILSAIKNEATKGFSVLRLFTPIKESTRKQLEELGYRIPPKITRNKLSIQIIKEDNPCVTIHWS